MGMKIIRLFPLTLLTLILFPSPAHACIPLPMSAGYGAVFIAYVAWAVIGATFYLKSSFIHKGFTFWLIAVPIGFLGFAIPVPFFPAIIFFIAFPLFLAVQFFIALFDKDIRERSIRLAYFGIPTIITIVLGIIFKYLLYVQNGGLRTLIWNYFEPGKAVFIMIMGLGIVFLIIAIIEMKTDKKSAAKAKA